MHCVHRVHMFLDMGLKKMEFGGSAMRWERGVEMSYNGKTRTVER